MAANSYVPRQVSRSSFVSLGEVNCHLREWGAPDGRPALLLHGARDCSQSYQFVADALADDLRLIAPDWRGHGLSSWTPGHYWHADFLADLDRLFEWLDLPAPPLLVGHSMGGNIASIYAGLRPERICGLIMLDSMGNPLSRSPVRVPLILTEYLDSLARPRQPRAFASVEALAARLEQGNSRLSPGRARFLAHDRVRQLADGQVTWQYDPSLLRSWPNLHTSEESGEVWGRISVPVICLLSADHRPDSPTHDPVALAERSSYFREITIERIPETGHNIHIDAPLRVAAAINNALNYCTL